MPRRSLAPSLAALLLAGPPLAACGEDAAPTGEVRVVHGAPEVGGVEVQVLVGGEVRATLGPLAFGEASAFRPVEAGDVRLEVHAAGAPAAPLATLGPLALQVGRALTLVVSETSLDGSPADATAFLVADDPAPGPAEPQTAWLRLVHAAGDVPLGVFVDRRALPGRLAPRGELLVSDLPVAGFSLGLDLRDDPELDVSARVEDLDEGETATAVIVRVPTDVPAVRRTELLLLDRDGGVGRVVLE